eukprot:11055731-Lingulodinium_polyedra.AAC.1
MSSRPRPMAPFAGIGLFGRGQLRRVGNPAAPRASFARQARVEVRASVVVFWTPQSPYRGRARARARESVSAWRRAGH